MKKVYIIPLIIFLSISATAHPHGKKIAGIVSEKSNNQALIGAHVSIKNMDDTTEVLNQITNDRGFFRFSDFKGTKYVLKVSYVGYENYSEQINTEKGFPFYKVELKEDLILKTLVIKDKAPAAVQRGDTSEMSASQYKVNKDANAEDLVSKMPGITIENNGIVKAQGEQVQKVLVDGKPFMGDDPTAALKNLPAEIIDKVQVFDQLSEQSRFTGFNDGNTSKTMNIVTKQNRKNGTFGKLYAGAGNDNRYQTGLTFNRFKGERMFTLLGMSNNINQQNFAMQDLFGVMGGGGGSMRQMGGMMGSMGINSGAMFRGGGDMGGTGNFLVGQQNGISTTNSAGINFSDKLGSKLNYSGSYFFNATDNKNEQLTDRKYFLSNDSLQYYNDTSSTENYNYNHRLNARIEWNIDTMNSIVMSPKISYQNNHSLNQNEGVTFLSESNKLNDLFNNKRNDNNGYNFNNELLFRHRFVKPGRTFSVNLGTAFNYRQGNSNQQTANTFYKDTFAFSIPIVQISDNETTGKNISSQVNFTEQIGKFSQLQFSYNISNNENTTQKYTYKFDTITKEFTQLDNRLSNEFQNQYLTNRAGVSYRWVKDAHNFSADLNVQKADLNATLIYPKPDVVKRNFENILPSIQYQYRKGNSAGLRFNYRTSTNAPSVSQMQNVIDNSNPLSLSVGNPNLSQSYSHSVSLRFNKTQSETAKMLFAFVSANFTRDYIGNSTTIGTGDSVFVDGIPLRQGAQISKPINLDGNWGINSFLTYGFPIKKIKCNLNMNLGVTYNRLPSLINLQTNFSNSTAVLSGFVLSSNISEKIDFTLAFTPTYTFVENTIQKQLNSNFYSQNSNIRLNWVFYKNIFINSDLRNILYSGLSGGYNQNFTLWSAAIGTKFLANNSAEIKLSVFDVLKQNNSISRNVSDTYIEDIKSLVLTQYFMLTFTYNLRVFKPMPN